jgi:hypothetical protein
MGLATNLVPLGTAPELAKRVGWDLQSKTTTAATQGSAGGLLRGPGNKWVNLTVNAASDAATLPSDAEIGDMIAVHNASAANSGFVFPQTGGTINLGTANQKATLAAGLTLIFFKVTATNWKAFLTTAVTLT